jgi:hypothetical protein
MGEDEKLPVAGRVIWLTPKGAQGKRTAGIGVQFSDQDRGQTQKKIETYPVLCNYPHSAVIGTGNLSDEFIVVPDLDHLRIGKQLVVGKAKLGFH